VTKRILISASRVAVSRPGYDVINPPAKTPDYLAVDSSFAPPLRLCAAGVLYGVQLAVPVTVSFGTTFSSYPHVLTLPFSPGSGYTTMINLYMLYNSIAYVNPYQIQITKTYFRIGQSQTQNNTWNTNVYDWIYYVFAP